MKALDLVRFNYTIIHVFKYSYIYVKIISNFGP